ncbi:MAG: hypothetical protein JRH20_28070 [Deltaproteobacteria bacterium]|nr:hypothetical protein [Deltaproteobacteria bacterium]
MRGQGRKLLTFALALSMGACSADDSAAGLQLLLSQQPAAAIEVGQPVSIEAAIEGNHGLLVNYRWQLRSPEGTELSFERLAGASAMFIPRVAGSYEVLCTAEVEGAGTRSRTLSIEVRAGDVIPITYLLQLTPPDESGVLPQQRPLLVVGEDKALSYTLTESRSVALDVTHEGQALSCTVLVRDELGSSDFQRHLLGGKGHVSVGGAAWVVVIPDALWLAPWLAHIEANSSSIKLMADDSQVAPVTGTVRSGGSPLMAAKVALYGIEEGMTVPSTLGESDIEGAFEVVARGGARRLVIVPPAASGLPTAVVEAHNVSFPSPSSSWVFDYEVKTVELEASVQDSAGAPLQGARVLARASSLQAVGSLFVGETSYIAEGRISLEFTTDASGKVVTLAGGLVRVPDGSYELEVIPPPESPDGRLQLNAQVDGLKGLSMQLPQRVTLRGVISDTHGVASFARVELQGLAGVEEIIADALGAFSASLTSDQSYGLVVRPPTFDFDHAPLVARTLTVGEDHGEEQERGWTLPRAVHIGGEVLGPSGAGIAGVSVSIYHCNEGCVQRAELVNETRTTVGGRFALRLPQEPAP